MEKIGTVDSVEIISLVEDTVEKDNLWAAHGLSFFIKIKARKQINLLMDTGPSSELLYHNMKILDISFDDVNFLLISHEHDDHTGALYGILNDIAEIPVIAHPGTFKPKFEKLPNGTLVYRGVPRREEILEKLQKPIFQTRSYTFTDGVFTTGEIRRIIPFEDWNYQNYFTKTGNELCADYLRNEQALIINVKDKGLIILTGCTHSGVINTIRHAMDISGQNRIYAIIGGLHLKKIDEKSVKTITALNDFDIELIVPCHCTTFEVIKMISERFALYAAPHGHFSVGETLTV